MMGPVEALKLALEKEDESIALYKDLSVQHSSLEEIFSFLITEEFKHKKLINEKLRELTRY